MPTPETARRHPLAVFYGDSILTGWRGVTAPGHRWPAWVCERLGWRETTLAIDGMGYVRRRGPRGADGERRPSDTDTTLLDAAIRLEPDVLVVCLGANDLGFVDESPERVRGAIRRDLGRVRGELPVGTPVVVTTYFPVSDLSPRAQRIEDWVIDSCREFGHRYVDALRGAIDGSAVLLCDDGVHPNDDGHRILADVMAPVLAGMIAGS